MTGHTQISIHAAREGGDKAENAIKMHLNISIHAAREGGDAVGYRLPENRQYFNPRRP